MTSIIATIIVLAAVYAIYNNFKRRSFTKELLQKDEDAATVLKKEIAEHEEKVKSLLEDYNEKKKRFDSIDN